MRRPLLQRLGYVLTAAGLALLCVAGYRLWGSNLVAAVVEQTMEPTSATLWLRPSPDRRVET